MPLLIMIFALNLFPNQISVATHFNALVFWNVGQGQWITYSKPNVCLHFDIGGEYFPISKIKNLCSRKKNLIFLSHWDLDHIGGIKKIQQHKEWLQKFCLAQLPSYTVKASKTRLFKGIPFCRNNQSTDFTLIPWASSLNLKPLTTDPFYLKHVKSKKKVLGNDLSHIYMFEDFLIPGDSPHQIITTSLRTKNPQIKILSLSHHGSKTGTSTALLDRLPKLKIAVSSARYAKYRHPHSEVIWALQQKGIPMLRTEDWGNIFFIRK